MAARFHQVTDFSVIISYIKNTVNLEVSHKKVLFKGRPEDGGGGEAEEEKNLNFENKSSYGHLTTIGR